MHATIHPSTTITTITSTSRLPRRQLRTAALISGIAYLATFVFSIPVKFWLWKDVLDQPGWILGAGSDAGVPLGAAFEVLTGLFGVVTALAVYSVLRTDGRRAALGFVTTRVMEATIIFVGVFAVMTAFTLRNDVAGTPGADDGSLLTTGHALVAVHDWAFLIGPGVMAALNALCFATVLYRTRLVPRAIPAIGLVGAPLLLTSALAVLFGAWEQISTPAMLLTLPIAAWELSVGVYMTVKGFRPGGRVDAPSHGVESAPIPAAVPA